METYCPTVPLLGTNRTITTDTSARQKKLPTHVSESFSDRGYQGGGSCPTPSVRVHLADTKLTVREEMIRTIVSCHGTIRKETDSKVASMVNMPVRMSMQDWTPSH